MNRIWKETLLAGIRNWDESGDFEAIFREVESRYRGFYTHIDVNPAPKKRRNLIRYLSKYLCRPQISLNRLLQYSSKKDEVVYKYNSHSSGKSEIERTNIINFTGPMVQQILPPRFKRIRYYGLQSPSDRSGLTAKVCEAVGRLVLLREILSLRLFPQGFVRLKCGSCPESILVSFSCKCRGFCPSCAGRRMSERSINLTEDVIPFVTTRHWVLSVPFELRYWMAADDDLLKKVNRVFCDEIRNYLRKKARKLGVKGGETGIVSYLQRTGGALNLNLHYHLLVLDGLYTAEEDGEAIFTRVPGIHNDELACVVRGVSRRVIKYLRKAGRLSEDG